MESNLNTLEIDELEHEGLVQCHCCKSWFPQNDTTEISGFSMCKDCATSETFYCEHCHESYLNMYMPSYIAVKGGLYLNVCQDCQREFYFACGHCHELHYEKELNEDDLCISCASLVQCSHCDEWFPESDIKEISDKHLCDVCYRNDTFHCEHCNTTYLNDEMESHNATNSRFGDTYTICSSCMKRYYGYCVKCDRLYHEENMVLDENYALCNNCLESYFSRCDDCDSIVHNDYIYFHEASDSYLCRSCYNGRKEESGIHNYSYKPAPLFHIGLTEKSTNKPYYGLELETDNFPYKNVAAKELKDEYEDNYYMKEDGSLTSGIEFVFHPRTAKSWQEYDFESLTKSILDQGGRSFKTSTCGIHIHRSRKDLTVMDLTKLLTVMIKLERPICKLAQRSNAHWASFNWDKDYEDKFYYKSIKSGQVTYSRYVAVNLQNEETIEFRIFKGTLKASTIQAYIAWAHHFINWIKELNIVQAVRMNEYELLASFKKSLSSVKDKNLMAYLTRKGWL
jgi:hypothetical protein